jgi:hypothetical protein
MTSFPGDAQVDAGSKLSPPPRGRPRSAVRSLVLAIVLLLCGGGIGVGLTLLVVVKHVQYAIHHPEGLPHHVTGRLRSLLDLSDQQAGQVEDILRTRMTALQEIHRRNRPYVRAELDGLENDVAAVLDVKQAEHWRDWFKEKRHNWLPAVEPAASQP